MDERQPSRPSDSARMEDCRRQNQKALLALLRSSVFPDATLAKLGVVLGGISVLALLQQAITLGLAKAIATMVAWYDAFLSVALGWLKPPIEALLVWVCAIVGFQVELHDHWKHVFVIANVYFMRNAFTYTRETQEGLIEHDIPATASVVAIALILSALTAGLTGVLRPTDFPSSLLVALVPLFGFFVYDSIERVVTVLVLAPEHAYSEFQLTRRDAFQAYMGWAIERLVGTTFLAVLLTSVFTFAFDLPHFASPVLAFLCCTVALALYWISGRASLGFRYRGLDQALPVFVRLLRYSGTTLLGTMMLGTVIWGAVFVLLNAGLGLVGL